MPVLPYDLVSAASEIKETIKGYAALIANTSDSAGQGDPDAGHSHPDVDLGDLAQPEGCVCFDTKPAGASVSSRPIGLDLAQMCIRDRSIPTRLAIYSKCSMKDSIECKGCL